MKNILFLFIFSFFSGQKIYSEEFILMGSKFRISIVAKDEFSAKNNIKLAVDEIFRIENLISEWISHTQVSMLNKYAGIKPIKVDREVISLTQRALSFSENTEGAFDISFASMDKIWRFDGSMDKLPTDEEIKNAIKKIGYKKIIIDTVNSTLFLSEKGMKIGFGATGKSYAADKARALLMSLGVDAGIVDASGDMALWGSPPDEEKWKIGIAHPIDSGKIISVVKGNDFSIVTSGSYEKFIEIEGKHYSHIINPVTGYPATGLVSVTVIGPVAEIANGISTSVMVLGKKKARKFLKNYQDYKVFMVTDTGKIISIP